MFRCGEDFGVCGVDGAGVDRVVRVDEMNGVACGLRLNVCVNGYEEFTTDTDTTTTTTTT